MTYKEAFPSSGKHCKDVQSDRVLGGKWEQKFCEIATLYNRSFTCHQFKKSEAANCWKRIDGIYHPYLLPDVTLWTAPGEHHEIKHKNAMSDGTYGLEVYRWEPLLWFARETRQSVYYTIHDHDLAGGRDIETNNIDHWVTANVLDLDSKKKPGKWPSYRNGQYSPLEDGYKWHKSLFVPLQTVWDVQRGYSDEEILQEIMMEDMEWENKFMD